MDLVESETRGGADGNVVRKFYMKELVITNVLKLVNDLCQHFDHQVVYTFHTTVAA